VGSFEAVQTSVVDDACSGRSSAVTCVEVKEQIRQRIRGAEEIASETSTSRRKKRHTSDLRLSRKQSILLQ
jgi:hypothetical protein